MSKLDKIKQRAAEAKRNEIAIEQMESPSTELLEDILNSPIIAIENVNNVPVPEQIIENNESKVVIPENTPAETGNQAIINPANTESTVIENMIIKSEIVTPEVVIPEIVESKVSELKSQTSLDSVKEQEPSNDDRTLTIYPYQLSELISWGTNIKTNILDSFEYYAVVNNVKQYVLINSLIQSEIDWEENHPEFPDKKFVMSNIRNREKPNKKDYTNAAFMLTPKTHAFLKETSSKCGLKMYEFLQFLIEEFIGVEY